MDSIDDLEKKAWDQITAATQRRDPKAIAHYSTIAQEIAEKKNEWRARLNGAGTDDTSAASSSAPSPNSSQVTQNYTGQPIRGFVLHGKPYPVRTYKDLLVELANLLRDKHSPETFDKSVLNFGGRKRRYFSKDPSRLKYAQELKGGGLFVETNLNANLVVNNICIPMVYKLEGQSDFRVELGNGSPSRKSITTSRGGF
jgi:hypothetical protein